MSDFLHKMNSGVYLKEVRNRIEKGVKYEVDVI